MGTGQLLAVCPEESQNQKLEKQALMAPKQRVGSMVQSQRKVGYGAGELRGRAWAPEPGVPGFDS